MNEILIIAVDVQKYCMAIEFTRWTEQVEDEKV